MLNTSCRTRKETSTVYTSTSNYDVQSWKYYAGQRMQHFLRVFSFSLHKYPQDPHNRPGCHYCKQIRKQAIDDMRPIVPKPSEKTVAHFKQMIKDHEAQAERPKEFVGDCPSNEISPTRQAVKPKWRQTQHHERSLRPDGWLGLPEDDSSKELRRSWKMKRVIPGPSLDDAV